MIQKSPNRGQAKKSRRSPTTTEIARRREEIRSEWSSEERYRRTPARRVSNQNDKKLQAQLRFIEFLIAHEKKINN